MGGFSAPCGFCGRWFIDRGALSEHTKACEKARVKLVFELQVCDHWEAKWHRAVLGHPHAIVALKERDRLERGEYVETRNDRTGEGYTFRFARVPDYQLNIAEEVTCARRSNSFKA